LSPLENKGTAMGIYSSAQFIGAFIGGAMGGVLYQQFGLQGIFFASSLLIVVWLLLVLPMQAPRHYSSRIIHMNAVAMTDIEQFINRLNAIKGVKETVVVPEEQVAYVKFSPEETDVSELESFAFQS
jgi:MFS family permease